MNQGCHDFRSAFLVSDGGGSADSHLASCDDCRAFVRTEQATKGMLRAHAPRWSASIELRERLTTILEKERRVGPARRQVRRRALVAGAVACVVAAAIGTWRWGGEHAGRQRAHAVTDLVVEDFLKYSTLGAEKFQISSADPATVEVFFREELQLAAKVPRFHGAALIGGRRCSLAGRPAALMFLERRNASAPAPLSLFVFESGGEDWSAMEEVPGLTGRRACHRSQRGVGVLVWEERGLVYALVGAEEIGDLVSVVEGHL